MQLEPQYIALVESALSTARRIVAQSSIHPNDKGAVTAAVLTALVNLHMPALLESGV